ncbi:hypothetical protein SAMN02990966_02903 [Rhodospirillales bacterium URHD0017]|nr:hypothetical protein SAMN02990966_02903 [Rhodospirillales bacterium URHD0017]
MPEDRFVVRLFCERGLSRQVAEEVVRLFDLHSGPVVIKYEPGHLLVERDDSETLSWPAIFGALRNTRAKKAIPDTEFIFLLMKSPNEFNWYATEDPDQMRNAFGHVGDFTWVTTAPPAVISAHYVLKAIFNALVTERGRPWEGLWHKDPRGCFYDFCAEKQQMNLKLRTADICGDCMQTFQDIGIPDALIGQTVQVMEASRLSAINTGPFLPKARHFDAWPFPVAVTRHKAIQAQVPMARLFMLFDHFDCLIRYLVLTHATIAHRPLEVSDRASLGWWVQALSRAGAQDRMLSEVLRIAEEGHVVQLRNEMRGHGYLNAQDLAYQPCVASLESTIEKIEREVDSFLRRHRLVVPLQFGLAEGRYYATLKELVGSNLINPETKTELAAAPDAAGIRGNGKVHLFDSQERLYRDLTPYLLFRTCPSCNSERLLVTDGARIYLDPFVGHRVSIQ